MKKEIIFTPLMLAIGVMLFLLKATGLPAHIAISIIGILVLAVYTATTIKSWKIPALEIIMRVCYGIALITGIIIMNINGIVAINITHKVSAALFVVLLAVLFVHKLIVRNKADK